MSTGEGKGWAKGKTAATDERVAKNGMSRRGMKYVHHLPPDQDRRHRPKDGKWARTLPLEWSDTMAYVTGLMATDGCLISNGRHLAFDSGDEELVITFLQCLGRPLKYRVKRTAIGGVQFQAQFGDVLFYRWLMTAGLTPRKSLTLGPIAVPDAFILPLTRGLLDGDGSLVDFWYDGTGKARGKRYEGFVTAFNSASKGHLAWLQEALARCVGVRGALCPQPPNKQGTVMWKLAYAIRESTILLPRLYPTTDVPCLKRKWLIWAGYAERHGFAATLAELGEGDPQLARRDERGRFQALTLKEPGAPYAGQVAFARSPLFAQAATA